MMITTPLTGKSRMESRVSHGDEPEARHQWLQVVNEVVFGIRNQMGRMHWQHSVAQCLAACMHSKAAFTRLVYLTNICKLWILAMSTEHALIQILAICPFPTVYQWMGHKGITTVYLLMKPRIVAFSRLDKHMSVLSVDDQCYSVRCLARGQVHALW
jgi:hypothetical protein